VEESVVSQTIIHTEEEANEYTNVKDMEKADEFDNWQDSEEDYKYKRTNQIKTGLKEMIRLDLTYKKDELVVSGNGILILKIDKDNLTMVTFD
jgi:mannose-6-phosphate isomerase-like protein (cupin superfamily)